MNLTTFDSVPVPSHVQCTRVDQVGDAVLQAGAHNILSAADIDSPEFCRTERIELNLGSDVKYDLAIVCSSLNVLPAIGATASGVMQVTTPTGARSNQRHLTLSMRNVDAPGDES